MIEISDSTHSKCKPSPISDKAPLIGEENKSETENEFENKMAEEVNNLLDESEYDTPSKPKRKREKKSAPAVKPAITEDTCSEATISVSKLVAASMLSSDSSAYKM